MSFKIEFVIGRSCIRRELRQINGTAVSFRDFIVCLTMLGYSINLIATYIHFFFLTKILEKQL